MATIKFGDPAKVAPTAKKITGGIDAMKLLEAPDLDQQGLTLSAYATIAAVYQSRHILHDAIMGVWEIDIDALGDPKNADHPHIDQMKALYQMRLDAEFQAWMPVIEFANGVQWLWRHMEIPTRHASGLVQIMSFDPATSKDVAATLVRDVVEDTSAMPDLPPTSTVPPDLTYMIGRMPGTWVDWTDAIGQEYAPF